MTTEELDIRGKKTVELKEFILSHITDETKDEVQAAIEEMSMIIATTATDIAVEAASAQVVEHIKKMAEEMKNTVEKDFGDE